MIVHVLGARGRPAETYTELIIHTDTLLPRAAALGSNTEFLREVLSFKVARFVDLNTAYTVEVSVCGCQLCECLFTHKGNIKGVVRQQTLGLPDLGACLHEARRMVDNGWRIPLTPS